MPFHWCYDETLALLSALPFLSFAVTWIRNRLHKPHQDCHLAELEAPSPVTGVTDV